MSQRNADDMGMPSPTPMTQPVSPEDALNLAAVTIGTLNLAMSVTFAPDGVEALRINPDGTLIFKDASEAAKALHDAWLEIRADPPKTVLDEEVVALAKEFEKVDGYRGDIHRALARIALTRLKDRGTD